MYAIYYHPYQQSYIVSQCLLPVIEGLHPVLSNILLDLWFTVANWHSLAKLRMHSDFTATLLKEETSELGRTVRKFAKDTEHMTTYETAREKRIRDKRHGAGASGEKRVKKLNVKTPKFHAAGYYHRLVIWIGTTDS